MFDIGFIELLFCFVIALIVLGPEKLPRLARTLGHWTGQARGYLRNLTAELDRESKLAELKQQLEEANKLVRSQSQSVGTAIKDGIKDVEDIGKDVGKDVGKDLPPRP